MADRWFTGEGDGPELAREATEGIVAVFAEHGPVLRALADAAADDPDVDEAYTELVRASSTRPPSTSSARSPRGGSCRSTRARPRPRSCG